MFKAKITYIAKNFFVVLVLAFFAINQAISVVHSLSHDGFVSVKAFDSQQKKQHKDNDCILCFSAGLQSQTFIAVSLLFAATIFYLTFFSRIFDRIKISYLLFSNFSRAPPFSS